MAKVDSRTSKELKQDAGSKFDRNKLRMDLIPVSAIEGLAAVLTYGANKYADRNWERGISWSRVFSATMRHLWAWYRGEDLDRESSLPHLFHAMCNIAFLCEFRMTKRELDDRPIRATGGPGDTRPGCFNVLGPEKDQQIPAPVLDRTQGLDGQTAAAPAETETNINGDPWGV